MKARTKLVLLVLVLFLVSLIPYNIAIQWYLNYQAMKLEKDPPSFFSVSLRDHLVVYPVFTVVFLGAVSPFWIIPFLMFLEAYRKERQKS